MSEKKSKKKNKKKKQNTVIALVGCLAVLAVATVSVAVVTAVADSKEKNIEVISDTLPKESADNVEVAAAAVQFQADNSINLEELQPEIEDIISDIKQITGGEWSVYITIPKTGDILSINQQKMQAASVIKLYIMCAVYEQYDEIKEAYQWDDIDGLIESMIEISDNEAADTLVTMLGRGDSIEGREIVNDFCKKNGFTNTNMDRMMGDDNIYSDNYTTTEDTAKLLQMIYEGEFEHSKDMLNYMSKQTRTLKIPAGVPENVRTANKTGELDDVHNDAAIVFTKYPYIICVMSDGIIGYQEPIDAIVDISAATYDFIAPRL